MNIKQIQILSEAEADLEDGRSFYENKKEELEGIFGTLSYLI